MSFSFFLFVCFVLSFLSCEVNGQQQRVDLPSDDPIPNSLLKRVKSACAERHGSRNPESASSTPSETSNDVHITRCVSFYVRNWQQNHAQWEAKCKAGQTPNPEIIQEAEFDEAGWFTQENKGNDKKSPSANPNRKAYKRCMAAVETKWIDNIRQGRATIKLSNEPTAELASISNGDNLNDEIVNHDDQKENIQIQLNIQLNNKE
jgi:hypothetical protein